VNKIRISSITSIIPAIVLGIGLGILFVLPIVSRFVSDPYRDTEIENTIDSLMKQGGTLPALSFALIVLGSIGLGVHSLKKYYVATSSKQLNR
jgi:hypothetical protein